MLNLDFLLDRYELSQAEKKRVCFSVSFYEHYRLSFILCESFIPNKNVARHSYENNNLELATTELK